MIMLGGVHAAWYYLPVFSLFLVENQFCNNVYFDSWYIFMYILKHHKGGRQIIKMEIKMVFAMKGGGVLSATYLFWKIIFLETI